MSVIYIFESLHKLIKADNLLAKDGFRARVIPVPTSYHSVCGMCLEAKSNDLDSIENLLDDNGISFEKYIIV